MAKFSSKDIRVYYGGYDIGTATTRTVVFMGVEALDPTAFTDSAERILVGLRRDRIEWAGLFDDGTSYDAAQAALIGSGTNNLFTILIGTGTGSVAYAGTGLLLTAKPQAEFAGLVRQEGEIMPDSSLTRGAHYGERKTLSNAVFGTIDNAAATTAGGTAYLHVFTITSGTVNFAVDDSADGTTWAELLPAGSFGGNYTGGAPFSRLVTISGTIRRYTRASLGGTGTANSAFILSRS